jgi:uncharacterized protein (TIRG00374 family)
LVINASYALNNLLPFRLGEVGRALLLSWRAPLTFWQVFPTVVVERAFDLGLAAGILLASLPFVLESANSQSLAWLVLALVAAGLACLYLLARNAAWALGVFDKLSRRLPLFQRIGRGRVVGLLSGVSALAAPRRFLGVLGWMALVWAITAGQYYLIIKAFVPQVQVVWATFSLGVVALGVAAPSAPGLIGVMHAAMVLALAQFQVDTNTAFACALVLHFTYYLTTTAIGLFTLVREGQSLVGLFRLLRQGVSEPASPVLAHPADPDSLPGE